MSASPPCGFPAAFLICQPGLCFQGRLGEVPAETLAVLIDRDEVGSVGEQEHSLDPTVMRLAEDAFGCEVVGHIVNQDSGSAAAADQPSSILAEAQRGDTDRVPRQDADQRLGLDGPCARVESMLAETIIRLSAEETIPVILLA